MPTQPPAPAPPFALNGLFDEPVQRPVVDEAKPDNSVRDATHDAGDFFNFTLEPGSTIEPAAVDAFAAEPALPVHTAPNDLDLSFADDLPALPALADQTGHFGDAPATAQPEPSVEDLFVDHLPVEDAPAAEDDFSLSALEDPLPPMVLPPEQDFGPSHDDLDLDLEAPGSDPLRPSSAELAATGPTLSSRVGLLAQSLEDAERFGDAALLYEVQALLSAAGR